MKVKIVVIIIKYQITSFLLFIINIINMIQKVIIINNGDIFLILKNLVMNKSPQNQYKFLSLNKRKERKRNKIINLISQRYLNLLNLIIF